MSKQRIYEYAKELNLKSKEIIDELKSMNIEVSNHMQALEDDQIKALDKKFKKNKRTTINKALKIITKNQTIKIKIKGNKKITKRINNKIIKATKAIKRIIEIIRKITRIINHKVNQLLQKKYHQK